MDRDQQQSFQAYIPATLYTLHHFLERLQHSKSLPACVEILKHIAVSYVVLRGRPSCCITPPTPPRWPLDDVHLCG